MKKIVVYILIALSVGVVITMAILLSNPLRRSEDRIRANMLKLTPIGTSMEDVIKVVEGNEKWKINTVRDYGYLLVNGVPSFPYFSPIEEKEYDYHLIGEKSMCVYLGEYRTIFITSVEVYYAFDEDSKLIDIAVKKDMDAM